MSKETNTTEPGLGPAALDASTVPDAAPRVRDTTPGTLLGADTTTIDVEMPSSPEPGMVARYRTDPGLPDSPETSLLRNVRLERRRAVVGFRDGLADVREGSRSKAERDAALERLASGEPTAPAARTPDITVPMRGRPSEPAAIRRLVLVGLGVVLAGVLVLGLVRVYFMGDGAGPIVPPAPTQTTSSAAAAPVPLPPPIPSSAPPPTSVAPSAKASAPTSIPAPSVSVPIKPHPVRSAEPTAPTTPPKPSSTVFDPTQGT